MSALARCALCPRASAADTASPSSPPPRRDYAALFERGRSGGVPPLFLAPMEGLGDRRLRRALAFSTGGFDEACREFTRVPGVLSQGARPEKLLRGIALTGYDADELTDWTKFAWNEWDQDALGTPPPTSRAPNLLAAQLMGSNEELLERCARFLANEGGAPRVDLNCGCPANVVTGKGAGLWNGAYSSQEKFTQLDVRGVVEYARLRGVRVIVEFDMPGHAGSWCTGHPEICPSASCLQPLNVAKNATFELIEDMLHQCTGGVASAPGKPSPGVFKDNFVHLGGDEVDTSCWTKTPAIAAWLTAQNMTADDGYAYFVKRAAERGTFGTDPGSRAREGEQGKSRGGDGWRGRGRDDGWSRGRRRDDDWRPRDRSRDRDRGRYHPYGGGGTRERCGSRSRSRDRARDDRGGYR